MALSERIYVYGYVGEEREFLHTYLDEKGARGYVESHKKMFKGRFKEYALWRGDKEIEIIPST